ncbi:MAG: YqgE/AlgH family protein [Ahrensia sp.]|nr:YqgE/AlgH family protein [Ahrensia sp.]
MSGASTTERQDLSLIGQFLLAMPGMSDPRFARSAILMISHGSTGAMGFILNQPVESPSFDEILKEIGLTEEAAMAYNLAQMPQVFRGGPVEQGRGFVLHSLDFGLEATARIGDIAALTATQEVLRAIAKGRGPERSIVLLGYAGWSGGQVEDEIIANGWLSVPATHQLLFDTPWDEIYSAALASLGVSEALLSSEAGHA